MDLNKIQTVPAEYYKRRIGDIMIGHPELAPLHGSMAMILSGHSQGEYFWSVIERYFSIYGINITIDKWNLILRRLNKKWKFNSSVYGFLRMYPWKLENMAGEA